jgi:O-antigen/teichoic acid export membrane protein
LPGAVGYAAARPMQAIGQGSGRIRTLLVATAGPALLNVVLNAALIPRFGMYGAAAATSVGYGSMFVFLVWASRQIGYRPLADIRSARIAATALLSAPIIVLFEAAITSELLALAVVPPVGCAIFTASALLTGALDRTELVDIGERLPAPLGAVVKSSTAWAED